MIEIYTSSERGKQWLEQYRGCLPIFACVLGFSATGSIEGISAAGKTPADRQYTAIADAEFLANSLELPPRYPLPPLESGMSPVFISRAVISALDIPLRIFNAGLPRPPATFAIDLGGIPANCLSSARALPLDKVRHLLNRGRKWGEKLGREVAPGYLIIGECVVGGTTTALGVLTGLGIEAVGKVNSSHPRCNHQQKWGVVETGLRMAGWLPVPEGIEPLALIAAVGDPMQIVAAGMAIAASRHAGVMLAGGTQMLAVYALMRSILNHSKENARLDRVVIGTTKWVVEDPTGDTVGLAEAVGEVPLLATKLSFASSRYSQLRAYERGYVKEGVGAGGCAIAAHLYRNWSQEQMLAAIERLAELYENNAKLRMDAARQ